MTSQADGYVFVKGCDSCPLIVMNGGEMCCGHPSIGKRMEVYDVPPDKAHPDCPLRKHSLHIALEPTA